MRRVRIQWTGWEGREPVVRGEDDAGVPIALPLEGAFTWHVGGTQTRPEPPPCVFEPRSILDPEHHCDICDTPADVYLAFYGTKAKVGMTMAGRLDERLREQGADAGFRVADESDRGAGRRREQTLSRVLDVPEWRRSRDVLPRLARRIDREAIMQAAERWRQRLPEGLDAGPLRFYDDGPCPRPLPAVPAIIRAPGDHAGTWIGAHGNHLFFHPSGAEARRLPTETPPVLALKRQELEGRWIVVY